MKPFMARPLGMQVIIAYKVIKAVLVLTVAAYLTASSKVAYQEARHMVAQLIEHGGFVHRLAVWLDAHVTESAMGTVRVLALLDGATTALEAGLLLSGKSWGEWLVVASLALLLPFEAHALWRYRRIGHVVVLVANTAIVVYLARRRYRASVQQRKPVE
jgi:uncharacterized membrane protein (DUF2068 family)